MDIQESDQQSDPKSLKTPDNFISVIRDFTNDLSRTFPEYIYLWERWSSEETDVKDYDDLYKYCLGVYPERFFDILYQNDDIFLIGGNIDQKSNTLFLPYVEFKMLFNCDGISENTKKTIWKYLQLVLVTIMSGIQDKSDFGDTATLFDGIDETDLHSKLAETINGLSEFFKNSVSDMNIDPNSGINSENTDFNPENMQNVFESASKQFETMFEGFSQQTEFNNNESTNTSSKDNIPDPNDLNDHLKNLFGGKIGNLAKELAEELTEDVMEMFGQDAETEVKSTQDVLKKIMKNPKKMMDLLKTVSTKIDKKMKDGEISQEDIMKEAGDIMGKMKEMGGGKEFQEMMRNMTKGMAGKGARFDKGAMDRMMKSQSNRERMRNKLQERNLQEKMIQKGKLEPSVSNPQNLVFKIDGDEGQEKSVKPVDDWLEDLVDTNTGSSSKKQKKKKTKK
jgi:hypothetical protein